MKKISKKIEGLKKYIKDFTLLDKKEYKHLALWKEYLIYSVFMGYNDNFVKKINEMININDKKNNII